MIVVDTNVIAYLWIPGENTVHTERVFRLDPHWVSPLLWRSEFRNVLTGALRKKRMSLELANQIMSEAEALLRGREYTVSSRHVLELADRSGCSAYDCEFVALAEDLGTKLVTTDQGILKEFSPRAVSPDSFRA